MSDAERSRAAPGRADAADIEAVGESLYYDLHDAAATVFDEAVAGDPDFVAIADVVAATVRAVREYGRDDRWDDAAASLCAVQRLIADGDIKRKDVEPQIDLAIHQPDMPEYRWRSLRDWMRLQLTAPNSDVPPPRRRPDLDRFPGADGYAVLRPDACAVGDPRPYVVKGLIAERDFACIFGPPGAGKSMLGPYLGYAVALGAPFFGHRTRKRSTLYVAAEDPAGMQLRVKALHDRLGQAPLFGLVSGVTNLLSYDSPDMARLVQTIEADEAGLVIIDTAAMAFPGLDENAAQDMGRLVSACRKLTESGAAVVLITHTTKAASTTDGTPRGHSVLNGALDVGLQLAPKDDSGVIRARVSKNRNGPAEADIAFRIEAVHVGTDADGEPITAGLAEPLPTLSGKPAVRLPDSAKRALSVAREMADKAGQPMLSALAWRDECVSRHVAGGATLESQRRSLRRTLQTLVDSGLVSVRDDELRVILAGDEFGSVAGADKGGQRPDKPDCPPRQTPTERTDTDRSL